MNKVRENRCILFLLPVFTHKTINSNYHLVAVSDSQFTSMYVQTHIHSEEFEGNENDSVYVF